MSAKSNKYQVTSSKQADPSASGLFSCYLLLVTCHLFTEATP